MKHKGKAVVFESVEEFHEKIDDPDLDVDEHSILVLKNCGPKGYPGMAEVGNMRLPQKILKKGLGFVVLLTSENLKINSEWALALLLVEIMNRLCRNDISMS